MKMRELMPESVDPTLLYFIYVRRADDETVIKLHKGVDGMLYVRPLRAHPVESDLPHELGKLVISSKLSKEGIVNSIKKELCLKANDKVWFVDKTFRVPYNKGD